MDRLLRLAPLASALLLAACQSAPSADVTTSSGGSAAPETAPVQPAAAFDADLPIITVYKSPTCGCCQGWVDHLRESGFRVEVVDMNDRTVVTSGRGVPRELSSCHTGVVGDYFVEGHVPAEDIRRLVEEEPNGLGLAVPGMPIGSPGMEQGDRVDPYDVILVSRDGQHTVWASHGGG
jgi:hypothetical protein